jgi:hypothetical protein
MMIIILRFYFNLVFLIPSILKKSVVYVVFQDLSNSPMWHVHIYMCDAKLMRGECNCIILNHDIDH